MKKTVIDFNSYKYDKQIAKFENAVELWNGIKTEFQKIEIEPNLNELLNCENVFKYCVNLYWAKYENQFPKNVTPTKALYLTDFQIVFVEDFVKQLKNIEGVYTVKDSKLISTIDKEKYNVYLNPAKEDEYNKLKQVLELITELKPSFGYSTNLMRALGTHRLSEFNSVCVPDLNYFKL